MLLISLMMLLPPATKLGQGNVFTGVCDSVNGGAGCYPSMHCRWYSSMPCSRSPGGVCSWGVPGPGGSAPGGCLLWGWPSIMAFCCGLLLCPSVMAFWFGGLLIEGSLLVWSSGGQKAITEGHHTRRP